MDDFEHKFAFWANLDKIVHNALLVIMTLTKSNWKSISYKVRILFNEHDEATKSVFSGKAFCSVEGMKGYF